MNRSIADRAAILSAIGCREKHILRAVQEYSLPATDLIRRKVTADDVMTTRCKGLHGFISDTLFEVNVHSVYVARSRCVHCLLKIHFEIYNVREKLNLTLRLHIRTHYPEAHHKLSVSEEHRRDDRVHRAFVRLEMVEMPLVKRKGPASVLKDNTCAIRNHAGAEMVKYAADKRDCVALLVHGRYVDGL